jgi:hypothetical protein
LDHAATKIVNQSLTSVFAAPPHPADGDFQVNTKLLAAVGAAALCAAATAQAHHSGTYASPNQPIPYSQLDSYLKASPSQRASMDTTGAANTGTPANTSATTGTAGADMSSPPDQDNMAAQMKPSTGSPGTGSMNAPATNPGKSANPGPVNGASPNSQ